MKEIRRQKIPIMSWLYRKNKLKIKRFHAKICTSQIKLLFTYVDVKYESLEA